MKASLSIATYLVIAVAPIAAMFVPESDAMRLYGVAEPAPRPTFTWAGARAETFQRDANRWFERDYGFRSFFVRADNSISYWGFGEASSESPVRIGRGGVLYIDQEVEYYNRAEPDDAKLLAEHIVRVTKAAEQVKAAGKHLVLLFMPGKLTVRPDSAPAEWLKAGGDLRPSHALYGRYADAMRAAGVSVVEARALMTRHHEQTGLPAFTDSGRHLAKPTGCEIINGLVDTCEPFGCLPEHRRSCKVARWGSETDDNEEFDLWRLLNELPTSYRPYSAPILEPAPPSPHASARRPLFVGTSMSKQLIKHCVARNMFPSYDFFYYNETHEPFPGAPTTPIVPFSPEWNALVDSRDLIVVEQPEWGMPTGFFVFFEQLITHWRDPEKK